MRRPGKRYSSSSNRTATFVIKALVTMTIATENSARRLP
jgi:hypothetical protein